MRFAALLFRPPQPAPLSKFDRNLLRTNPGREGVRVDGFWPVCSNDGVDPRGKILAVDYGEKSIGLACSDDLGLTVQPLPSIPNRGQRDFLKRLQSMARAMGARGVVVGMPLNMDGTRGDAVMRMERLMNALKRILDVPLIEMDERLSTLEALEFWRNMSPRQQKKYRTVDSLAAALILERYLKEG